MIKNMNKILILLLVLATFLSAQNRGNNPAYQGFGNVSEFSARALGMGGAFTSMNGTVDALFYNAAGLATIDKMQISIGMNSISRSWTENQVYYSNRYFVTLPFYLERLYVPDPSANGMMDRDVFYAGLEDSSYVVNLPETGNEPYSDDAANWKKELDASGISNFSLALPLNVMDKNVVIGLSYNNRNDLFDYDRNETYLDPHPGYLEYGMPPKVESEEDSTMINWYDFSRERDGSIAEFQGAVGVDLNEIFKVGLSLTYFSGETNDMMAMNKIGWFNLIDANRFRWSYDTLDMMTKGTSTFSGIKPELGFQLTFDVFSFGLNMKLPYTVKREWNYKITSVDTNGTFNNTEKGEDELSVPFSYAIGVNFHPTEKFTFSLDYDLRKYADAEWSLGNSDTTHNKWIDQNILRFGIEYTPVKMLALRAGYRSIPQVFVPDGAAFKNKGPEATSYTFGLGLNFGKFGSLNAAWEYRLLKYADIYFSNKNYCKEVMTNLLVGYTYRF